MEKELDVFAEREWKEVLTEIPGTVIGRNMGQFNEKEYESSLKKYMEEFRGTFEKLQKICDRDPEKAPETIKSVCRELLDAIGSEIGTAGKWFRFNERALQLDTYKMVILTYLTPAVLNMELEISGKFVHELHEEWIRRYPKQPYKIAEEQEIAAGFGRRWYHTLMGRH